MANENGSERLDRIERILEEMAARQQYHDEAFERHDANMKRIEEAVLALARIAEAHQERLKRLEGNEPT